MNIEMSKIDVIDFCEWYEENYLDDDERSFCEFINQLYNKLKDSDIYKDYKEVVKESIKKLK